MKPRTAKRSPAESEALKNCIMLRVELGYPVKRIASELAVTEGYVYTILRRMGYEMALLSVEERWIMRQLRTGNGKFTETKRKTP